jgi:hypothetical protein
LSQYNSGWFCHRAYRWRGWLGVADSAGVRAFRPRVVSMIYDIWRIMTRRDVWCLPRGRGGRSCGGRRTTTTTGGGGGRALAEGGDVEVAGVLGSRGSAPGTPAEVTRELRELVVYCHTRFIKNINRATIYAPGSSHAYIQQSHQDITTHITYNININRK